MTVALSILFAALVGGAVFALIDASFARRDRRPAPAAPTEPRPAWEPQPEPERRRDGLWAGWARD
jgi:hypothetical protein